MEMKQDLTRLHQSSSEQLGIQITGESSWAQLGADSRDHMEMLPAIGNQLQMQMPHTVGDRTNTACGPSDDLLNQAAAEKETSNIRIDAVTTNQQWVETLGIRTQVFTNEYGFSVKPLPGPGERGIWHFLARDNNDAIGTLSVVDTTGDSRGHQRYRLNFGKNDRVARFAQLAILKPYRKRGIFKMLTEAAENTVIRPNGFAVRWLLYPAERARSSVMVRNLGFAIEAQVLATEFGKCQVLVRRESSVRQMNGGEDFPIIDTCPI
jgi:GNAT superfamily N-acetyltransferase/acyl carrier protein